MNGPLDLGCTFNNIVIVDCLADDELQTAKRLHDDLRDMQQPKRFASIGYVKVKSRADFLDVLGALMPLCEQRCYPILHIEAHGNELNGLELANGSSLITWHELATLTRHLNKASQNNLSIVLSVCEGLFFAREMKWNEPSPFNFLVGATTKVSARESAEAIHVFYSVLAETMSLDRVREKLPRNFTIYQAALHFIENLGEQYRLHMVGTGGEKMRERLLSNMTKYEIANQYLGLKKLRQLARKVAQPNLERYVEQSKAFFHGEIPIPYDTFLEHVREIKISSSAKGSN